MVESLNSTINALKGKPVDIDGDGSNAISIQYLYVSIFVISIFTPLTWVRDLEKFKYGFMLGVSMILLAVLTISYFCYDMIKERGFVKPPSGYYSINDDRYWDMIGFSFFMFEGVGSVMPVMNACDKRAQEKFPYILAGALATLCTIYILFSELCYFTFGDDLKEAIVM